MACLMGEPFEMGCRLLYNLQDMAEISKPEFLLISIFHHK
jgi:hypothetical protein